MQKLINTVKQVSTRAFFIILRSLTSVSHILTVSNYQVCSNDEFDQVSDSGPDGLLIQFSGGNGIACLPDVFSFAESEVKSWKSEVSREK